MTHPPLECPVCERGLDRRDGRFACENGHSFDVAKEGYVNLLPAQHKSRGIEGDVAEMLQARRRFLQAGYYEPLRRLLAESGKNRLAARDAPVVVEAGCGEGYYIGGIAESLPEAVLLGTDLSKAAVRLAAKRYSDVLFFVSDVHRRIYLKEASVSLLLDVFAPRNPTEFARVLEPGGTALIAIPGENHLRSFRDELGLLDIEEDKERRVVERMGAGFEPAEREEMSFPLTLPAEAARDLVEMGPSRWHGHADTGGRMYTTEAAFVLLGFRRRANAE